MSHIRTSPASNAVVTTMVVLAVASLPSAPAQAAGLLIADGGFGGVLKIEQQDVQVTINNGIAVTEVTQVFRNTEDRVVEALYTFPVPKGGSVANFSMWINGKEMIGEVVEKQRARQIYESYKQTRRDPGLLEQVDYKQFEMRIFPIPAGAEQRVKLEYYQELDFDHDWATYVYPLATATRTTADQHSGELSFSLQIKSEVPIVAVSSPSHADDIVTVSHSPSYFQASYERSDVELSQDIVMKYQVERPRTGLDLITSRRPDEDGYFLMTLTVGKELDERNVGADYVFVIDASGSMADDGKLRLSRECIMAFSGALTEMDRFEMISFNIAPTSLFQELKGVEPASIAEAEEFLETQRARGGTVLQPALQAAYKYKDADRPLNVVILSDGMTEQLGQTELVRLLEQSPPGTRVFCVGVGNEVNRPLLSQLADQAGGLSAFLSRADDFQQQADAFRRKLTRPAATNLQLTIDGGDVYDVTPQALPSLYHGAPLRIYGRYRQPGTVRLKLEGDILGAPFEHQAEVQLARKDMDNPHIERMWASRQVEVCLRKARATGQVDAQSPNIKKVVQLCEEYSIVSEYASFIVLENDAEYRRWKIERRNANRIDRDRDAARRVAEQLARLRERAAETTAPQLASKEQDVAAPETDVLSRIAPPAPVVDGRPSQPNSNSSNFAPRTSSPSPGGGGAIDPVSGLIAAGLAAGSALAARRRRRRTDEPSEL